MIFLNEELPKYGENVVLVYGVGSIKENGIYDKVINILKKNEKISRKSRALCRIRL